MFLVYFPIILMEEVVVMEIGGVGNTYAMMSKASATGDVQRQIAMKIVKDQAAAQEELIQKLIVESQVKTPQKSPYRFDTYA